MGAPLPAHYHVETMEVEAPDGGRMLINKSEYDSKVHKKYKGPPPPKVEEPEPEQDEGDGLDKLSARELRELAQNEFGVVLGQNMNKAKMIAGIRDLRSAE
jgi:hypothetical protein